MGAGPQRYFRRTLMGQADQGDLRWAWRELTEGWWTCQQCGVTSRDVYEDYDPYAQEIFDELILVTLCPHCFDESAADI